MSPVHQCHICQQILSRSTTLRAHLRSHNNDRPFKCSECDKAFARSWDLEVHKRTHDDTRSYVCGGNLAGGSTPAGCGSAFTRKRDLTRHLKSAKGAKCNFQAASSEISDNPQHTQAAIQTQNDLYTYADDQELENFRLALRNIGKQISPPADDLEATNLGALPPEYGKSEREATVAEAARCLNPAFLPLYHQGTLFHRLVLALYRTAKSMPILSEDLRRQALRTRARALEDVAKNMTLTSYRDENSLIFCISILIILEGLVGDGTSLPIHINGLNHVILLCNPAKARALQCTHEPLPHPGLRCWVDKVISDPFYHCEKNLDARLFVVGLASSMSVPTLQVDIPALVEDSVMRSLYAQKVQLVGRLPRIT